MDWRGFFKPSWKKAGVFVLICILLMPLVLWCSIPPRASSGGSYTSCKELLERTVKNPIAFFVQTTILLPAIAIQYIPWSVLFALAAYLLACAFAYFLAKKPGKAGKKKS